MHKIDLYSFILGRKSGRRVFVPPSWNWVRTIVRAGLAPKIFRVGDLLVCHKDGADLLWMVIGFNHDRPTNSNHNYSMTLQLVNCYKNLQFDAREAFYVCTSALPADTYCFTVGAHSWVASDVGKTFQFTLNSEVPAGGQLVFTQDYNVTLDGAGVDIYSGSTSTTKIGTATMTEGDAGISLGTINNTVQTNLNSMQRALLGSNRWKESAIRQLLNSSAAAGSVWTPQTAFDRPPAWATSEKGWMNGIDSDFLDVVGEVEKITARNIVIDGGGYDITAERFFLVSREEVYGGRENNVDEGGAYEYYSKYSDLSAAGEGEDTNRIKYLNGTARWWWLRTPNAWFGNYVRTVNPTGAVNNISATNGGGFAPACNII